MDISKMVGDEILNPSAPLPAPPPPEVDRYGPYYLIPSYGRIAECTGTRRIAGLVLKPCVVLYTEVPALMATDGNKLIMSPLSTFDSEGFVLEPPRINPTETGVATFALPVELFEELPTSLPAGQSHLSLEIAKDPHDKRWYAYVQEQPLPRTPKRYRVKGGINPDPCNIGFPTSPMVQQMLLTAASTPTAQVGVDTSALADLTEAMNCEAVNLYVHGRTGVIQVGRRSIDVSDPYASRSLGLLMPLAGPTDLAIDDREAGDEDDEHYCSGNAC